MDKEDDQGKRVPGRCRGLVAELGLVREQCGGLRCQSRVTGIVDEIDGLGG